MKPEHTPLNDPLRTETPGLGPAPLRHDIGQNISPDIGAMRTETWHSRPRRRAQWPFWVAGLAVVGVAAAMMFDIKPDQWVSAHLDRPAPAAESLPLPSEPTPQAQTDASTTVAQAPDTSDTAPASAEPARSQTAAARRAARDSSASTEAALQPLPEPAAPAATVTPPEPAPVPADPKAVPVDPAAPTTGP